MFHGVYTALITPFRNGSVDYEAIDKILEFQIKSGVTGVVPMGTTGESPTVSHEEHVQIIKHVVRTVSGRVKVIAGAGSNSTKEAVYLARMAEEAGADAILTVNPYYNRPTQNGLIAHFAEIANSIKIPVVLYNIPSRTNVNFLPESTLTLLDMAPNILAMKEATGDIIQMMRLHELCGERLAMLTGDDNNLLPFLSIGGKGVISVLSNILPAQIVSVVEKWNAGNIEQAREEFYRLLPLSRAMFVETNPIPIKAVMAKAAYCSDELRLPLQTLPEEKLADVLREFEKYGVKF